MTPRARTTGLITEWVDDELVVYDRERDRAHRLNRTAAVTFRHADGQRTVEDLVAVLRRELDPAADEDLVWLALERLSAAHLLETPVPRTADEVRTSRRHFVRKVGLVGALSLLLPVVATISAPTAAQAQSCALCGCSCLPCEE